MGGAAQKSKFILADAGDWCFWEQPQKKKEFEEEVNKLYEVYSQVKEKVEKIEEMKRASENV